MELTWSHKTSTARVMLKLTSLESSQTRRPSLSSRHLPPHYLQVKEHLLRKVEHQLKQGHLQPKVLQPVEFQSLKISLLKKKKWSPP